MTLNKLFTTGSGHECLILLHNNKNAAVVDVFNKYVTR